MCTWQWSPAMCGVKKVFKKAHQIQDLQILKPTASLCSLCQVLTGTWELLLWKQPGGQGQESQILSIICWIKLKSWKCGKKPCVEGERVRRGVCKLVDPRATEIALTFQLGPGMLNLLFFFFLLKKAIKTYNSNSQKPNKNIIKRNQNNVQSSTLPQSHFQHPKENKSIHNYHRWKQNECHWNQFFPTEV